MPPQGIGRSRSERTPRAGTAARWFAGVEKNARRHILVVDDEPLIRWWLTETLGERGYDVAEAESGVAAIQAMSDAATPFDVVLLDYRLPDSNDFALLSRVRSLAPDARVVLMTAYGSPEVQQGALERGAYRIVNKPFNVDELAAIVSEPGPPRS